MGSVTKITRSTKKSKSVKTTIPEGISEFLQLSHKDAIEWLMQTNNDERYAIVRKATAVTTTTSIPYQKSTA